MKKSPVTNTWSTVNHVPFAQAVERYITMLGAKKLSKEIAETAVLEAIDSGHLKYRRTDQNYDFKQRHLNYYRPPEPATTWELMQTGRLLVHRESFDTWIESQVGKVQLKGFESVKQASSKEVNNLHIIIGALRYILIDATYGNGKSYSDFDTLSALIDTLLAQSGKCAGMSERNLQKVFAEASRLYESSVEPEKLR